MNSVLLETSDLRKQFGGLVVTDGVSFQVRSGELHAVIGPNGAGKTTLIEQLSGELSPSAGRISFDGDDITGLPTALRSRRGLARSFQITNIFRELSVLDNVALAVQAHVGHSFRFWRPARKESRLRESAQRILERVALGHRAELLAANLSHGEKRALEIALALATRPRLLLLDEPMAGMGPEDSGRMLDLLKSLKGTHTIVLVEHDMDAVFALADRISVLVYGRLIATGTPQEVRNNPQVRLAYLGEGSETGSAQVPYASPAPVAASSPPQAMLQVRNLTASYGESQVLHGVSFDLFPAEVVTLLGRNGMGKTSTVSSIMGILAPTSGEVVFRGRPMQGLHSYQICHAGLGLVPEGRLIFPNLTVAENLVATAANRSARDAPWNLQRVLDLFPSLAARKDSMAGLLSGGEQQMLAVGRALMTNPLLLILDEATEGLAPLLRAEIWRVIEELKAGGQAILVIDKNVDVLTRIASRHYILEKGKVVWAGSSHELRADPGLKQRYLGV